MKRCNIILLLMLLLFASCTENKEAKELFVRVDSLMDEYPDSALAMLDSAYSHKGEWRKSQQMRYELLRAKAQNKAYVDFTTDSVMKEVVEYYDAHGTSNEQMEAHYLLGCTYRDLHESPMALSCYLDATEKADTLSDNCDYGTLMRIWGQVADEFDRQAMPFKELDAYEMFLKYALRNSDSISYAIGMENKAKAYVLIADTSNIILCLNKASHLFNKLGRHSQSKFVLSLLIPIYIDRGELDKAEYIMRSFEMESSYFKSNGDIIEGKEYYYKYKALLFEKTNVLDSAEYYYKKLINYGYEYDGFTKLLDIYERTHRPDSIYKYSKLIESEYAKGYTNLHTQAMFNADGMFNYSRNHRIALEKEKEANHNLNITFAIVTISLLIFIIVYIRYKNVMRQKEIENDKVKTDYHIVLKRYSQIKADMNLMKEDYSEYVKSKEKELEEIKAYIKDKNYVELGVEEQDCLNKIMQSAEMKVFMCALKPGNSYCPTNKDWVALTNIVSDELPLFYARITKDNILSKGELHAVILTRLGLSTTEISFIMDKSIQHISNLKSSANKKLFDEKGAKGLYEKMLDL